MPNFAGAWTLNQQAYARGQNIWPAVPGAPTIGTATAGSSSASVTFTAPTNAGYPATITGYTVTSSPGGFTGTGASSPITVSGLTNGTAYTFTVAATNATGTGPASAASNSATPVAPVANFIGITGTATASYPYGTSVDSSSNMFLYGAVDGQLSGYIAKYNGQGTLQLQRTLSASGKYTVVYGGKTDSSGNIYVGGYTNAIAGYGFYVAKLDSTGAILWQTGLSVTGGAFLQGFNIDSSGNVYGVGYAGSTQYGLIVKWDSSGTLLWQRSLGTASVYPNDVVADTSGNVYVVGNDSTGTTSIFVNKYNSSGTLQWQKIFSAASRGYGIALDSSQNPVIGGWRRDVTATYIAKLTTAGAITWQSTLNSTGETFARVAIDSSDNIYFTNSWFNGTNATLLVAKWNTSGTFQWQRAMAISGENNQGYGIAVDSSAVYVNGSTTLTPGKMLFARLPVDGSKTGSYSVGGTTVSYAASSMSAGTGTYTVSNNTLTDAAGAATSASPGLTSASVTVTSSVTTI